jgi:hypothetical protein
MVPHLIIDRLLWSGLTLADFDLVLWGLTSAIVVASAFDCEKGKL